MYLFKQLLKKVNTFLKYLITPMLQFGLTTHKNVPYILHCFGVPLSEANTEAGVKTSLNLNLSGF